MYNLFNPYFQRKADEMINQCIDFQTKFNNAQSAEQMLELVYEHESKIKEFEEVYKQTRDELINAYESGAYDEI